MNDAVKPPVAFWIVGGLSLVWNLFGAVDYVMTQTKNAAYLAQFTPEQRAYFDSFPMFMEGAWALGIWGAVAGSLLLLARSRHAVLAFGTSLLGLLVSTIWQFGLSGADVARIFGGGPMIMTAFIWLVAIALFAYARKQHAKGMLR